jgi:hypothetical protein
VVYLDNILIYTHSKDLALYWRAVCEVLGSLRRVELFINLSKCIFALSEVHFLGFIIGTRGVRANPARTKIIMGWPRPTNIKEL